MGVLIFNVWYSYYVLNDLFLQTVYRLPSCSTCSAVEIKAAVTGTTALVIEVRAGFIAGDLVYHCVNNHRIRHRSQSCKPASCSHQQRQAGPGAAEKLELRENVAYVQSIELRTNQAYRLVSEPDPRGSGYETTYRHVLVLTATRSG